jgi:(R)-1-hydroxy-2-aminoethylphosphonate ammonia-lyase
MAVQLARLITGRYKTISMWDAFHGGTLDVMSLSGEQLFREGVGPLMVGTEHVPPPDGYRCMWDCHNRGGCDLKCANYIDYVMEKEGDVAALIAEPIRSTPYIPTKEYWQEVRRICDKHGAMLIFDEIPHALGRTGEWFTCMNFDVIPDILVMGKGIGGGILPLAVMVTHEKYDIVGHKAIGHFTHEKNPVLCATALATLNYIEENNLPQRARELGKFALARLEEMKARHPLIGDVRGLGLMLGIELVRDPITKERATTETEQVMYKALSRGVSFKITMGSIISIVPAMVITEEELARGLDIIEDCIAEVEDELREAGKL